MLFRAGEPAFKSFDPKIYRKFSTTSSVCERRVVAGGDMEGTSPPVNRFSKNSVFKDRPSGAGRALKPVPDAPLRNA